MIIIGIARITVNEGLNLCRLILNKPLQNYWSTKQTLPDNAKSDIDTDKKALVEP